MRRILMVLGAAALVGCASEGTLSPAPGAQKVAGLDTAAFGQAGGIQVWVDGAAWRGDPLELPRVLTPVKVTIDNDSQKTLRVAYGDFKLLGDSGFRYSALSPLRGQVPVGMGTLKGNIVLAQAHPARRVPHGPMTPRFRHRQFYVAPHFHYWYPGFTVWPHPFLYDPYAYDRSDWPSALPTDDMLSEALPEGALEPGGQVSGFVYFQGVARRESRVRFLLSLTEAEAAAPFGTVEIPFAVRD